jgi:hypothetical protein
MELNEAHMKYGVILSFSSETGYPKLLGKLCSQIISDDGSHLLALFCSKVDFGNPIYLEVVAHRGDEKYLGTRDLGSHIHIPHRFVLLVCDRPDDRFPLGFL